MGLSCNQEFVLALLRENPSGMTPTEIGLAARKAGHIAGASCDSAWACTKLRGLVKRGLVERLALNRATVVYLALI
jgi:hypothetical protein